jgi:hypothetical protein
MTMMEQRRPALWTPGDWNAFFGFGTNILVNMLVLTGLLRFVLKMPDAIVFGRILPAMGLMMCLSTFYYALLEHLTKRLNRRLWIHIMTARIGFRVATGTKLRSGVRPSGHPAQTGR